MGHALSTPLRAVAVSMPNCYSNNNANKTPLPSSLPLRSQTMDEVSNANNAVEVAPPVAGDWPLTNWKPMPHPTTTILVAASCWLAASCAPREPQEPSYKEDNDFDGYYEREYEAGGFAYTTRYDKSIREAVPMIHKIYPPTKTTRKARPNKPTIHSQE